MGLVAEYANPCDGLPLVDVAAPNVNSRPGLTGTPVATYHPAMIGRAMASTASGTAASWRFVYRV
jgi:hypothetical protein